MFLWVTIECYSRCMELDLKQSVSYTNRALCYIRINQPEKAKQDCAKAFVLRKRQCKSSVSKSSGQKGKDSSWLRNNLSWFYALCTSHIYLVYIWMFIVLCDIVLKKSFFYQRTHPTSVYIHWFIIHVYIAICLIQFFKVPLMYIYIPSYYQPIYTC